MGTNINAIKFEPAYDAGSLDLIPAVDRTGATTGAGIATFPPGPDKPAPDVHLLAPRGTVDAGDGGVRSAGDINVAALLVANGDNFAAVGNTSGIPTLAAPNMAA